MAIIKKLRNRLGTKNDEDASLPFGSPLPMQRETVANPLTHLGQNQGPADSVGFDKIYSLEEVDPKTVRKMQAPEESSPELNQAKRCLERSAGTVDEGLNFGLAREGAIESLRLSEPIQVLGLSNTAEKKLIENNKKILKDLLDLSNQKHAFGQGHIDEIQTSLEKYLHGASLDSTQTIDYLSILNKIFADLSPQTAYFLLRPYGLEGYFPLTQSDRASVNHLSEEECKQATIEASKAILDPYKAQDVQKMWSNIIHAFVVPWVRKRHGVSSLKEIKERLVSIGGDELFAETTLRFLESSYFKNKTLVLGCLEVTSDPYIFCVDKERKSLYEMVLQKARTYFYRPQLSYKLEELSALLYREFARSWNYIPEYFIERVMSLSPHFRVRKREDGLTVRLH